MSGTSQNYGQRLSKAANAKAVAYHNQHVQSQGDQALSILGVFAAAAAGIGGAIALPALYATNLGVGLSLVFTGAVAGAVAGFALPFVIHKAVGTRAFQYLKPSTYKQAMQKPRAPK